jgi:hypothetical protein
VTAAGVPRAGIEPAFSSLRTKRDRHYSNGACAPLARVELALSRLENAGSVQLSYRGLWWAARGSNPESLD